MAKSGKRLKNISIHISVCIELWNAFSQHAPQSVSFPASRTGPAPLAKLAKPIPTENYASKQVRQEIFNCRFAQYQCVGIWTLE